MTTKTLVSMISGTLMLAGQAFAQPYTFVPIDVRCPATADPSACPAGLAPGQVAAQTGARGISPRGDVVGFYFAVAGGRQRGFVLAGGRGFVVRNGMLETYDATPTPPTPTTTPPLTSIWDMNASQQFVGTYRVAGEPAAKRHGFLQNPDGSAPVTVDFTCQELVGCSGAPFGTVAFSTIAYGINPGGVIVGQYQLVSGGAFHAFVAIPPDLK